MSRIKLFFFLVFIMAISQNVYAQQPNGQQPPQMSQPPHVANRDAFAKRLNLTAEQKQLLDTQRQQDMQEIKPILESMNAKRNEYQQVMNSNLPQIEKEAKILKLKSEMKDLKAKADEKRSQNMKRFESVLTDTQRSEFEKIKTEGRQHRPPQGGQNNMEPPNNFQNNGPKGPPPLRQN